VTPPPAERPPVALGDGLVMRPAAVGDVDALAAFNAEIHRDHGQTEPNDWVKVWTRDLMTRPHPTFSVGDFLIVEETGSGRIVSSLNLISQTWSYGGVEFGVGRPELVGTDPAYRRRGLIRRQFEVIHRWSAERGELVQAITGIPWFYRQFGYEMALELGGGRVMPRYAAPKLKEGEAEPFRVRPATAEDLPFIVEVDRHGRGRYLVSPVRDEPLWRLELDGRSERARPVLALIETPAGEPVGFVTHNRIRFGNALNVTNVELRPGASWLAVAPTLLRHLAARGAETPPWRGEEPFEVIGFWLGAEHPLYRAAGERMPRVNPPYAFYVRVPDLPAFVRRIGPVLERRLAASVAPGHTGELQLSFYRSGLRLRFEAGRLAAAESFDPPQHLDAGAWFPDLTFLQLLFGRRSLDELKSAYPDCYARGDEVPVLLDALFPRRISRVWAID
jgi:GNAT superfamily N-acetyltransferase